MNNDTLENVTSDKLLGVTIDNNLSWEKHITTIVSTINRKLALLRRIKQYMPLSTRKLFLIHTFCLTLTTVQLSRAVHPYTEPVTSSKEGSSCDIKHNGHIPP